MKKLITLPIIALLLPSCSSISEHPISPAPPSISLSSQPRETRQIKREGSLSLKTNTLKTTAKKTETISQNHNAHITTANLNKNNYSATIRVPAPSLEPLMDDLSSLASVTHRRLSMDDLTAQYLDINAKIKNKRALRDRLRQLLARSTKIKDTLAIEKELARVQTELDLIEAQLKTMKTQVHHSTLNLHIKRRRTPGPLGLATQSTTWLLKKLF